jgi:hypothetical protein
MHGTPKKAAGIPDSFLAKIIQILFQKNLISQLYCPKISLELMSGIGKIPFQREIIEFLNDQGLADSYSIVEPCSKLRIF